MRKLGRKCIGIRKNWLGYGKDKEIGGDKKEAQHSLKNIHGPSLTNFYV
jgi:hypothetical protein